MGLDDNFSIKSCPKVAKAGQKNPEKIPSKFEKKIFHWKIKERKTIYQLEKSWPKSKDYYKSDNAIMHNTRS